LLVVLPPLVAPKSLKPQLNQIRSWVRQGRTDAWIAHQLEVTVKDVAAFKREHGLVPPEPTDGEPEGIGALPEEELDLRAKDDALVAAELEAEQEETVEEPAAETATPSEEEARPRRRRRGRRGGRRRRPTGPTGALEGTFDHGEEGYGLWLDPAVQDDPVYAEHWAGHRPVTVTVEPDRIVIRRAGEDGAAPEDAEGESAREAEAEPEGEGESAPGSEESAPEAD
jgi:hypothetical protein